MKYRNCYKGSGRASRRLRSRIARKCRRSEARALQD